MSKSIRVHDDVYEALKSWAEPLTDTPNDVIERLLAQRPNVKVVLWKHLVDSDESEAIQTLVPDGKMHNGPDEILSTALADVQIDPNTSADGELLVHVNFRM